MSDHRGSLPWPLDVPGACAAAAAALGLLALAGWLIGLRPLAAWVPGQIPMAPSTAVLFVLFGTLVALREPIARAPGRLRLVRWLALPGTALAAVLLVASARGVTSNLENLGLTLAGTAGGAPVGHMSPLTAGMFVLAGISYVSALMLDRIPVGPRRVGLLAGLVVVLLSAVLATGYALGGPLLYDSGVIPPALNTSAAFLLLGTALMGSAAQALRTGSGRRFFRSARTATAFALVLAVAATLIMAVAYGYFHLYQADFKAETGRELSAMADLKAQGVAQWRRERLGDATVLADNESFAELVQRVGARRPDPGARARIRDWLTSVRLSYGYEQADLLDLDGRLLVASTSRAGEPARLPAAAILAATSSGRPSFVDFQRTGGSGAVRLAVAAPITEGAEGGRRLALLYLQIDPQAYLYPFLLQWPAARLRTAATLLLRRQGERAVLLNDVPGRARALTTWVPLSDTLVPAARAVRGERAVIQGRSRDGVPVEAAVRPIPGSPWFIEARVGTREILAPLRERLWWVVGLTSLVLLALVGATAIVWQDRERRYFRSLADAESRERSSQARYRALFNSQRDAILVTDRERRITNYNPAFERLFGYATREIVGRRAGILYQSKESAREMDRIVVEHEADPLWVHHATLRRKDGAAFPAEMNISRLHDTETGAHVGFVGIIRDVTELRRVEQAKEELTAQLAQAQKLESVGRLAGGVAHDFNNMLAVITGHVELALDEAAEGSPIREDLEEIRAAADRSAGLTRQLLTFARRQMTRPEVLDLGRSLDGMAKMLRRLIGENIELDTQVAADLWPVRIDPIQLDQILANLVVNARDAIAGVGRVTIEVSNTAVDDAYALQHPDAIPGDFVTLAVSDDGKGMPQEVMAHLFEPFFTTKPPGEGTGLGLATVYGVVRQNGGFVNVYSEPGRGTTFRVYFPRHAHDTESRAFQESPAIAGRGETILVVEDETALLRLTTRTLEGLGYRVLPASTPDEALAIADRHAGEIVLVLTDVIMPGMNGRDLADKLHERAPELPILYMSGYAGPILGHVLDDGVQVIQKPFTRALLSQKIRETLERR